MMIRPPFELVARELYARLSGRIPQLAFVQLRDEAFGTTTRHLPRLAGSALPAGFPGGRGSG
jgi:hypothetical protein